MCDYLMVLIVFALPRPVSKQMNNPDFLTEGLIFYFSGFFSSSEIEKTVLWTMRETVCSPQNSLQTHQSTYTMEMRESKAQMTRGHQCLYLS